MAILKTRVATSRALDVYGGVELPDEFLSELAAKLKAGGVPFHFNHDYGMPVDARVIDAGVETLENGDRAVWANFELPDDEWRKIEAEFRSAGVEGGMSFSVGQKILENNPAAPVSIAADAYHFSDEDIIAATLGAPLGAYNASRLYQFSAVPEAAIVIQFVVEALAQVPADVLSGWITSTLKSLWRPKLQSPITVQATRDGDKSETLIAIRPTTQEEFDTAMTRLPEIIKAVAELQAHQKNGPSVSADDASGRGPTKPELGSKES